MDYKIYYKNIEIKLKEYSDVVYYEPLTNDEILEIEKQIGKTIKPLYRDFLSTFGVVQDAFEKLQTTVDKMVKDYVFLKKPYKDYLPIFCELDVEDTYYLINNIDLLDDNVYVVKVNSNDKIGKLKKHISFQQIIEDSVSDISKNYKNRSSNNDKVNSAKFIISADDFDNFLEVFKVYGLTKISDWQPKYAPKNYFGDEVAKYELNNCEIVIQRTAEHDEYSFEVEEPILTPKDNSIIVKTEKLLKDSGIEFEKIECLLI
jgi:hypothetical protein